MTTGPVLPPASGVDGWQEVGWGGEVVRCLSSAKLTILGLAHLHLHQQSWFLEPFRTVIVLEPLNFFLIILVLLRPEDWLFSYGFSEICFPKDLNFVLLNVVGYLPFLLEHPRWWTQCLTCEQHWVNVQLSLGTHLCLIPCCKTRHLWLCLFCNDFASKVRAFSFGIHSSVKSLSLVDRASGNLVFFWEQATCTC